MSDDVEAARAEIERTREQLQATVDQLSDRLDPRVRAKEAGESLRHTASDGIAAARRNPVPVGGVAAAVVTTVVAALVWRRRSVRRARGRTWPA